MACLRRICPTSFRSLLVSIRLTARRPGSRFVRQGYGKIGPSWRPVVPPIRCVIEKDGPMSHSFKPSRLQAVFSCFLAALLCGPGPASAEVWLVSRTPTAQSNQQSYTPHLSANGDRVAFTSHAYNLVPGDTNDSALDIFLTDLATGRVHAVSRTSPPTFGSKPAATPGTRATAPRWTFRTPSSPCNPPSICSPPRRSSGPPGT
jgi:hypothetical protein